MRTHGLGLFAALVIVPALATLTAFACSPAVPAPVVQQSGSATLPPPKHEGPDSPARWSLESVPRWMPSASTSTGTALLEVGIGGERWLKRDGDRLPAQTLLPGRIVGVAKDGAGYLFLLSDGYVYVANDPLGPATRSSEVRFKGNAAALGKSSVLVADSTGALQRSIDRGKTFTKVTFPIADGFVKDVAMAGGVGLALMVPQRLWVTVDDGATWAPIASPGADGVGAVLSQDGLVLAGSYGVAFTLDPATRTFSPSITRAKPAAKAALEEERESVRTVDGKHAVVVTGLPFSEKREWSFSFGELTAMSRPGVVDELTGCDSVDVALRGEIIEISCDARGTVDAGVDTQSKPFDHNTRWGGSQPKRYGKYNAMPVPPQNNNDAGAATANITKLIRSEDGGKTWKSDGVFDGGGGTRDGSDGVAIGDGGWTYIAERCAIVSYEPTCRTPRVRTGTGAFEALPTDPVRFVRFATNARSSDVYAIGVGEEVSLYRFKAGAPTPEKVARLAQTMNEGTATLTQDDDGSARGFIAAHDGPYMFVQKPDAKDVQEIKPPSTGSLRAALAGKYGLAIGEKAYETTDEGKTWLAVTKPLDATTVDQCSSYGCITNRGLRAGWDAAETQPSSDTASKTVFAKGLKCTAQGRWTKLGGGTLATVDDVDIGNARWLLPTRDEHGSVTLHVNKRGDTTAKTTDLVLTGPALQPPGWGTETAMFVQPTGVVVRRYTYSKIRTQPGVYNPVDAALTWYRGDTGKVFHGAVNKIPPFRVQHDPRSDYEDGKTYPATPELAWLDPRGVYFLSQSYLDDRPMYLLRDDGRTEKQKGVETNGDYGGVVLANGDVGVALVSNGVLQTQWWQTGKSFFWRANDASMSLFDFGGRTSALVGLSTDDAARLWAVPVKAEADPSEWFALPTQQQLGDTPKACDAPPVTDGSKIRYAAPFSPGSRRAVRIDVDGSEVVLATDRALVVGSTKAPKDACVSALDARSVEDTDSMYSALVFPDDLPHSLVFSVNKSEAWPEAVLVRSMECAFAAGPLPDSLKETDGFYTGSLPTRAPHQTSNGPPRVPDRK